MVLIQTQLCGNSLCNRLCVAGQHHGLAHTGILQAPDGLCAVGLHHVGDEQITGIHALNGHVHDGAGLAHGGSFQAQLFHQAGVAGGDGLAVHLRGDAVAAQLLHVGDAAGVDFLAVSGLDAQGDGVLGPALGQRGGFHQLFLAGAVCGVDAGHLKGALGQGAGLVEHHDAGAGQFFQIGGTLDEDAAGGSAADAAEEAQRNADDQCAGAADDQEGQGAVDPVTKAGGLAQEQQHDGRDEGQRQSTVAHSGGVDAGKAGDEVLGAGLLHAGIFHQVQNFRDGGFAELLGGLHLQQAGHVHTAADDLVAGLHVAGQTLTGQGGGVQGGSAFHDHAVDGHPLTGLHHDDRADLHIVRVHLLQLAVLALNVGVVRADIHQAGNALAALAHGHALEQLADLVEDDNGAAFHVVAQREGTHGGNGHQEALIEGLAVLDAQQCLAQHGPAHHQIRNAVQRQLHRRGELGQQLEDEHQHHRSDDAVQGLFLLFVHTKLSFLRDPGPHPLRRAGDFNNFSP